MTVTVPANSVFRCDENTRTHRFVKKKERKKKDSIYSNNTFL